MVGPDWAERAAIDDHCYWGNSVRHAADLERALQTVAFIQTFAKHCDRLNLRVGILVLTRRIN